MTTLAGALSRLTVAMIEVHERTCEIEPPHGWDTCTATAGIFAVADALDLIDADVLGVTREEVALAMHDRECQVTSCGPALRDGHSAGWLDQAEALMTHAAAEAAVPPPPQARQGNLMDQCKCGHIRRGHSVDGSRCYHTPCTCQADGGFRP